MTEVLRQVTITAVDEELRGTLEIPGDHPDTPVTLHIPGAAPGDVVDLWITSRSRHHPRAFAKVVGVHQRGELFTAPPCRQAAPVRGACGGCPGMHLAQQVRAGVARRTLAAHLAPLDISANWHEAPQQLGYRNRSNFVVQRKESDDHSRVVLGSFAPGSNDVASMDGCLIVAPPLEAVHAELQALIDAQSCPIGLEEGGLRWVSLRAAKDQVVAELIVADKSADYLATLGEAIARIDGVIGVAVSVNDQPTNSIRISGSSPLIGEVQLQETYGRAPIKVPAGAFAQLNPVVASQIYEMAATHVEAGGALWDLYCGIGALGINAALDAHSQPRDISIWGLESVDEAVRAAKENAQALSVEAEFSVVDLSDTDALSALDPPENFQSPSAILVNPPRRGMSAALRGRLTDDWRAPLLIYMSCSPKSFARDAQALIEGGWRLEQVDAFEMLPMTRHIEVLGIFRFD